MILAPHPAGMLTTLLVACVPLFLSGCDGGQPQARPAPAAGGTDLAPPKQAANSPPASLPSPHAIVGDRQSSVPQAAPPPTKQEGPSPFRFSDIAPDSGVKFRHTSGMTKEKHFPTANGSGVAMFDADNDGLMDIYFANACHLFTSEEAAGNRFYRNLGGGKFEDLTEKSGLGFKGFCHGIVVGDIDGDGDQDVFLATYKQNRLFENNGDGTFKDISESAGIGSDSWSSGGAFIDIDNDGDLDLYVSNYGLWERKDADVFCGDVEKQVRLYCSPRMIQTGPHLLYRNNGDRTFTNVYDQFLVDDQDPKKFIPGRRDGRGFGVVTGDFDRDGDADIYVANDMCPNFLFLNRGDGTFEDATELSGAAYDERGQPQSGMGVEAQDVDGDGLPELFVTNFANEYNTLYQNQGKGMFLDVTAFMGLAADSMASVGWGCSLEDFDSDGWPDCVVTNGHVDDNRKELGQSVEYEELPLLYRNVALQKGQNATRRFKISTLGVGPYFEQKHVGRGLAYGDLDNDGDVDLVINHKDGTPAILINNTPRDGNRWIQFKLVGRKSNREGIGARLEVKAGDRTIHRLRKGGASMLGSNDPRVTVGLGPAGDAVDVVVRWPSGAVSDLKGLATDKLHTIEEPAAP